VQSIETYSHLIPGANVAYVDCLDVKSEKKPQAPAQPRPQVETEIPLEVVDLIGGGGWTRTNDLRIMSRPADTENKAHQQDSSAECGKVRQNPQTGRKQNGGGE
jgi:hypothetical protein